MHRPLPSILLTSLGLACSASAASLSLDFQPAGGTTAAGYEAFEAANQANPATAMANYSAFGTTVTVTLTTANLPDGSADFRAVARNGSSGDAHNDWLGVDTRVGGSDVTMTLNIAGLPAGAYTWTSLHYDGGTGTTNGNLNGTNDYTFTDASGLTSVADGITIGQGNAGDSLAASTLSFSFTSDGSDVIFSQIMDAGQGAPATTPNALFALTSSLTIEQIPEPSTGAFAFLGLSGFLLRRRR